MTRCLVSGTRRRFLAGTVFMLFCLITTPSHASHTSLPEWFRFTATLERPPQLHQPVVVVATLSALVGELNDIRVRLMIPPGWSPASPTANLDKLAPGTSQTFSFSLQPGGPVPNGSIGCSFEARIPKNAMGSAIKASSKEEANALLATIKKLPERGGGFTDIAFALFPEEGFFPLGADMWLYYEDQLTPPGMMKGPVLYRSTATSEFQAKNDVDMFEKLLHLLATDQKAATIIQSTGFNYPSKRRDYLGGRYVLAIENYARKNYAEALANLEAFTKEYEKDPQNSAPDLRITAGNLRGICLWAKGDKKGAEEALKDTFYHDRKSPLHRYTLRNLGLLCLDRTDKANAREMLRLALELKPTYTLLNEEYKILKK